MRKFAEVAQRSQTERTSRHYVHWDKLRRLKPPEGLTMEEWWMALKFARSSILKPVPLKDTQGKPFQFCVPDLVQEEMHQIDVGQEVRSGCLSKSPTLKRETNTW